MSPVSKPMVPVTWARRLSQAAEHRYTSDGNSSSYSSAEDTHRQYFSPFVTSDVSGRSYVDPWDMENYSFIRKHLEDISLAENELSPAFETTQSDFYYVPLDNNGSPQYQYKRSIDVNKDGVSPQLLRSDSLLMANIDEYDFCNEHLDSSFSFLQLDDTNEVVNNNPSRQSERSRYNNQDYQTYTPPSIVKDAPDTCHPSQISKLRRRASVNFRPDSYACDFAGSETLLRNKLGSEKFYRHEGQKTLADVKIKLNRRKSFHDVSNNPDVKFGRRERRKSVMDHVHSDKWLPLATEVIPEHQVREKQEKRSSNSQMTGETVKKSPSNLEKGILLSPENRCNRTGLNVSFNTEVLHSTSSHSHSPLVYLYETTGRKRKVFLPSTTTKMFERDDFSRYSRTEIQDAFSYDPIEQYLNRPTGRYTMTNYGHLKIDYSCSWNYLDQCIAQRVSL